MWTQKEKLWLDKTDPEVADESLWSHALQYVVYLHNIMPHEESGMSPIEVWSRTKSNHHDLLHTHTWECPAYVLSPKLREGDHVPKWKPIILVMTFKKQ